MDALAVGPSAAVSSGKGESTLPVRRKRSGSGLELQALGAGEHGDAEFRPEQVVFGRAPSADEAAAGLARGADQERQTGFRVAQRHHPVRRHAPYGDRGRGTRAGAERRRFGGCGLGAGGDGAGRAEHPARRPAREADRRRERGRDGEHRALRQLLHLDAPGERRVPERFGIAQIGAVEHRRARFRRAGTARRRCRAGNRARRLARAFRGPHAAGRRSALRAGTVAAEPCAEAEAGAPASSAAASVPSAQRRKAREPALAGLVGSRMARPAVSRASRGCGGGRARR